jgi:hypothetical protein
MVIGVEVPPLPVGAAGVFLKYTPQSLDDSATVDDVRGSADYKRDMGVVVGRRALLAAAQRARLDLAHR